MMQADEPSGIAKRCGQGVPAWLGSDRDEGNAHGTLDACVQCGLGGEGGKVRGGSGKVSQAKRAPSPAVWSVVQVPRRTGTGIANLS